MARRRQTEKAPNDLDIRIIKELQSDARKPFTAIAEELGLPESTVRKRVDRLEATGVLQFTGFADPLRLGFQYWSYVAVKVELSALERCAKAIAQHHEVFFVGITTGDYNLFIAAVFRSNTDLLHFLNERLPKSPGVVETATSNALRIFKRTGHLFSHNPPAPSRLKQIRLDAVEEPDISDIDLRIMAALQAEGRKSFAQVASQLEISESTVHNRVQRLRQLGILQFEAYADPTRLGYPIWALFQFRVESRQPPTIAARLAQFPELLFVGVTTGLHDVFAAGAFRSNDDVLTFLTTKLAELTSIKSVTTTNVLKLVKRQLVYPLNDDGKLKS
ncbi:MAG: Lrp/AsnC family transcriptional regulator [Xanthobacteraceae bacterium]|nr:Lrp/AsnC family transcriptional regulator [Xanthobacteraceae bacterium]